MRELDFLPASYQQSIKRRRVVMRCAIFLAIAACLAAWQLLRHA